MLARDALRPPISSLRLDLDSHGLALGTEDGSAAFEERRVDPRSTLERVVPRAQDGGAVQPQHVTRQDVRHLEGQADLVALGHEIGAAVYVGCDVVARLGAQQREQLGEGLGGFGWWRGGGCSLGARARWYAADVR